MKVLVCVLLISIVQGEPQGAPYPPSGYRPEGEPFTLPPTRFRAPQTQYNTSPQPQQQYGTPPLRQTQQPQPNREYLQPTPQRHYGAPEQQNFNRPQLEYGAPAQPGSQFGTSGQQNFNRPQLEYGTPSPPQNQFPNNNIPEPQVEYSALPQTQYGAPFVPQNSGNNNPAEQPQIQYNAPSQPQTQYGTPVLPQNPSNNVLGQPQTQYGVPNSPQTQYAAPVRPLRVQNNPQQPEIEYGAPQDNQRFTNNLNERQRDTSNSESQSYNGSEEFGRKTSYPKEVNAVNKGLVNQPLARQQNEVLQNNNENNVDEAENKEIASGPNVEDNNSNVPAEGYGPPVVSTTPAVTKRRKPARNPNRSRPRRPLRTTTTTEAPQEPEAEDTTEPNVSIATAFAGRYYLLQPDGSLQRVEYKATERGDEARSKEIMANFVLQNVAPIREPIYTYNEPILRLN